MKIFLLTPIYATTTQGSGATPVVHYFAKEWVKLGHEVFVYNLVADFPSVFYWFARIFQHQLNSRLGILVPTNKPSEDYYISDGVKIHRICMKKLMPHSQYHKSQLEYAVNVIKEGCCKYGIPDVFIGHWDNPQMDILISLKKLYNRPISLVLHNNEFYLEKTYGENVLEKLKQIDYIGFRSLIGKQNFESKYFIPKNSFIASSGVSNIFIKSGKEFTPTFDNGIRNFIFVGSLIPRKYPCEILKALSEVYENKDFKITFIGDGNEKGSIQTFSEYNGLQANVVFTGRIGRDSIIEYLKQAEVFVMISAGEIFGLVYLEAMALGLIPIGSKNEGIDGIIINKENGFLCRAGDASELSTILKEIRNLSKKDLEIMSNNAKNTAEKFSDENVAASYLENLQCEV